MDIDFVFKIAAIGILTSVIAQVLTRAGREDVAMLATLSGLVVVLLMVVNMLSGFFDSVRAVFQLN
ncbi:MAG: stage III sporulation protein AC [Clostridiales bacterium]|nr:stage III sporulation protein AC [Clostridiales bacterium]